MNSQNAKLLNEQLKKFQETNIDELNQKRQKQTRIVQQYSRMNRINLPKIEYMQLCVEYELQRENPHTEELLQTERLLNGMKRDVRYISSSTGFSQEEAISTHNYQSTEEADFMAWLYEIERESFRTLTVPELMVYEQQLRDVFTAITMTVDGTPMFDASYRQQHIRNRIRQAFAPVCSEKSTERIELREALLMAIEIEDLEKPKEVSVSSIYYPNDEKVQNILAEDMQNEEIDKAIAAAPT